MEPAKRPLIHYIFFWTAGVGTLFVWNCVLSLTDYFANRYNPQASKYYPFFYNLGGFSAFLAFSQIVKRISFKHIIMGVPIILVVIFIAIYVVGEYYETVNTGKFSIFLALVTIGGFFNCILQTSLIGFSFAFTFIEISYFNTGTALVGIITNLIALVNTLIFDADQTPGKESEKYAKKGLVYLIFQIIALIIILGIFWIYCKTCHDLLPKLERNAVVQTENAKPSEPQPSLLSTMMLIIGFFTNMILIYTITLSIYPSFNFALGLEWDSPAYIQIVLLIFNVGDLIGKFLYSKISVKDGPLPQLLSLARIVYTIFIVIAFGGDGQSSLYKWWINAIFTGTLAISNGYLTSCLFSLSSERVPDRHKKNSGFLMTLGLLSGLTYGSLVILLGTK